MVFMMFQTLSWAPVVVPKACPKFCQGRLHHTSLRTDGAKVHKLELCRSPALGWEMDMDSSSGV